MPFPSKHFLAHQYVNEMLMRFYDITVATWNNEQLKHTTLSLCNSNSPFKSIDLTEKGIMNNSDVICIFKSDWLPQYGPLGNGCYGLIFVIANAQMCCDFTNHLSVWCSLISCCSKSKIICGLLYKALSNQVATWLLRACMASLEYKWTIIFLKMRHNSVIFYVGKYHADCLTPYWYLKPHFC